MPRSSAGRLRWILPLIEPPVARHPVLARASRHELPDAARSCARERQRLEAGFSLSEINQILRHAFFAEGLLDHLAVFPGSHQRALECSAAARGIEVDVPGDG